MRIDGDDVLFSTGTRRYANLGIVGLAPDLSVYGGYDQSFWSRGNPSPWGDAALTAQELTELADYMIEQWTAFKAKTAEPPTA